ncbi:MAG: DUF6550 family protein [Lachnospiraceae bacterium]
MKNEYEKKKKLVIMTLSLVALCLAGGLGFYLYQKNLPSTPEKEFAEEKPVQTEVAVPEISLSDKEKEVPETETVTHDEMTESLETQTSADEEGADAGKPQTEKEAKAPEEKPKLSDTEVEENPAKPPQYAPEVVEPKEKPEEPTGGSTNENGQIYVPGFGYMDSPGPPRSLPAESAGDWNKQIGDM